MKKFLNKQVYHLLALLLIIFFITLIGSLAVPEFRSSNTYSLLLLRLSEYSILAIGLSIVIISGGLDLSFGSVMALAPAVCGILYNLGTPFYIAFIIGLSVGLLAGLINALFIVKVKINPIIVTLGTSLIVRSLVQGITKGDTVTGFPQAYLNIKNIFLFHTPLSFIVFLILGITMEIILRKTVLGKQIYATGGSEKAAIFAGIGTDKIKYFAYILMGFLSALSGLILVTRTWSVPPRTGYYAFVEVMTAVIIGGVVFGGGEGSIVGPFLGVVIIFLLRNVFNLIGINENYNLIIFGFILIIVLSRQNLSLKFSKFLKSLKK